MIAARSGMRVRKHHTMRLIVARICRALANRLDRIALRVAPEILRIEQ